MEREVSRNPVTPPLNQEAIDLLTELCFRHDDPIEKVDTLFIFGSTNHLAGLVTTIRNILDLDATKNVVITGGIAGYIDSTKITKPESEIILDAINPSLYPDSKFYLESKSTNTFENVKNSLDLAPLQDVSTLLFIAKSHAVGRAYLTLRKFFPGVTISQKEYTVVYPGATEPLTSQNWHQSEFGRSRVWGEYERIKKYGTRGDIEFDEVRDILDSMEELLRSK
jgi:hypothetical protein